ncbi:MAG: hypothetical protein K2I96_17335 [Lachnospiraceae bacterium]|nr:hypothetical protein [Lachnospiraceae bacterium]
MGEETKQDLRRQEAVFSHWQILQSIPQKMRTIPKGLKRRRTGFINKTEVICKEVYHGNYHTILKLKKGEINEFFG